MTTDTWPKGVAAPARRALETAGYSKLADLKDASEDDLKKLHGMGRKALDVLRDALAEEGMSFKNA